MDTRVGLSPLRCGALLFFNGIWLTQFLQTLFLCLLSIGYLLSYKKKEKKKLPSFRKNLYQKFPEMYALSNPIIELIQYWIATILNMQKLQNKSFWTFYCAFYKEILHFLNPNTVPKYKINNLTKWRIFTWYPGVRFMSSYLEEKLHVQWATAPISTKPYTLKMQHHHKTFNPTHGLTLHYEQQCECGVISWLYSTLKMYWLNSVGPQLIAHHWLQLNSN